MFILRKSEAVFLISLLFLLFIISEIFPLYVSVFLCPRHPLQSCEQWHKKAFCGLKLTETQPSVEAEHCFVLNMWNLNVDDYIFLQLAALVLLQSCSHRSFCFPASGLVLFKRDSSGSPFRSLAADSVIRINMDALLASTIICIKAFISHVLMNCWMNPDTRFLLWARRMRPKY